MSVEHRSVSGRSFDWWLTAGALFVPAWTTGLVFADLLPAASEQSLLPALVGVLLFYVMAAIAVTVWYLTRYCFRAKRAQIWWGMAFAIGTVVFFAATYYILGPQLGLTIASLPFTVLLPLVLLLSVSADRTFYGAAWRGALIAGIAAFCYFCLYCLIVGFEGGYMVGDIGPGITSFIRGIPELGLVIALFCLSVWAPVSLVVAGAVGGILGERIYRVSQQDVISTGVVR